jgi:hypothetical protein
LHADAAAAAKAPGEIVGLDFDPFTDSQDPWPKYVVGRVTKGQGTWRVTLHGVENDRPHDAPDLTAELVREGGRWRFVNFRYPDGSDLLSILKKLARVRMSKRSVRRPG